MFVAYAPLASTTLLALAGLGGQLCTEWADGHIRHWNPSCYTHENHEIKKKCSKTQFIIVTNLFRGILICSYPRKLRKNPEQSEACEACLGSWQAQPASITCSHSAEVKHTAALFVPGSLISIACSLLGRTM